MSRLPRAVIGGVVTAALAAASYTVAQRIDAPGPAPAPAARSTAPRSSVPPSSTVPAPHRPRTAVDPLGRQLAALPAGTASVAAVDLAGGHRIVRGGERGQWLASVYKLLVLAELLQRHDATGTLPTGDERTLVDAMIRHSDNRAGYELFVREGGTDGLTATARRLGLVHTVAGRSDPAFTTSSARDCVRILEAFARPGRLSAASRAYGLALLRTVQADQRWGVGAAGDAGTPFANKNGWLSVGDDNGPGEDDGGRWITNSVGVLESHGRTLLVAVLTQHGPDFDTGVRLVEDLARAAVADLDSRYPPAR